MDGAHVLLDAEFEVELVVPLTRIMLRKVVLFHGLGVLF
jgi:hypothetical protein